MSVHNERKSRLIVEGGYPLGGSIRLDSAKNAVLPIIAASILHAGKVKLNDCTPISDVVNMTVIMEELGSATQIRGNEIFIDSSASNAWFIPPESASEIRSSIFLLGPVLSRFRKARVAYPGGCDIGLRPIDLHLKGLAALNVKIVEENGFIICDGTNMKNGIVHLDFPSVGATENIMMAAVLIKGRTQVVNAAKEPEIEDLQNFINSMGGRISGAGTSIITIDGVDGLNDTEYTPIKDRIIAGTYLIAAAMTGSTLQLENACADHIISLLTKLTEAGFQIDYDDKKMTIHAKSGMPKSCALVETRPYPGFATDLQAQMTALQAVSDGTCMLVENLFETRFKHVPELTKMGAKITIRDRCAVVHGIERLSGANVTAKDLRGGAALLLAGLNARGTTVIENAYLIDRGYYKIEEQLSRVGARVYREYI